MSDDDFESVGEKIAYVKARITPAELCEQFDIFIDRDKICSPWNPDERTPSCHLYEDHFFDFSTGKGGDIIDLAMVLSGKSWAAALNMLARGAQADDRDPTVGLQARPVEVPNMSAEWDHLPVLLGQGYGATAWGRLIPGVRPATLTRLAFQDLIRASETNMYIAHVWDHKVHGIKVRNSDGRKTALPGSQFGAHLYWARRWVARSVVITEGESDAWALLGQQVGTADICALPSGAGTWRKQWLDELEQYSTVYTAFDNDRAGRDATEKVRSAVGWGRWKELRVPQLYNDVRDAIVAGWTPKL